MIPDGEERLEGSLKLHAQSNTANGSVYSNNRTNERLNAGLRSLDHYKNKLPSWRYNPRQGLIPIVRWETPRLATMQKAMRSPALDSYFSITANLGTHTFFMVFLPILFWCGYTGLGRGMVHVLATGVILTGFIKDLLCLPRPLSPPLHRITLSESAALEYGFPSTHSTNAVSVAVYALFVLNSPDSMMHPRVKLSLEILSYSYAISIMLGRLYCGMHGFFDVGVGAIIGAFLSVVECGYGEEFDKFIYDGSIKAPVIVLLVVLILVRIHPEPADDCPCFDDSVAFAGVMIGAEFGSWHYAKSGLAWDFPVPATVPFKLDALGWPRTVARIVIGVVMVFAWRGITKPFLLKTLPPIFRIIEKLGLSLPRKFFKQASQYREVPNIQEDNVIPSVSEIPSIFATIRHPQKRRSVSIGPQSEADAYEALAYREERRRESISEMMKPSSALRESGNIAEISSARPRRNPPKLDDHDETMRLGFSTHQMNRLPLDINGNPTISNDARQDEKEERELFSNLETPRVRYDVEVITKLIVYSGIAWLAVEGNPILFEFIGLGIGRESN